MCPIIYIAGPLHTPYERQYLEHLANAISQMGFEVFLPHRDAGLASLAHSEALAEFFSADLRGLESAAAVFANVAGVNVDAGTAFEIGYAYATHKPVVALYEDIRNTSRLNLMILSSSAVFTTESDALSALQTMLK